MASRIALLVPGLALALASSLLLPQAARADVPREPSDCDGKAKGDACAEKGMTGSCQLEKCSKLDYSKGTPPSSVEYDCLECVAAPAPAAAEPAAAAPAAAPAAGAPAPAPAPSAKAGGCAIAGDGGGGMLALLLLVAGYRRSRRVATARPSMQSSE